MSSNAEVRDSSGARLAFDDGSLSSISPSLQTVTKKLGYGEDTPKAGTVLAATSEGSSQWLTITQVLTSTNTSSVKPDYSWRSDFANLGTAVNGAGTAGLEAVTGIYAAVTAAAGDSGCAYTDMVAGGTMKPYNLNPSFGFVFTPASFNATDGAEAFIGLGNLTGTATTLGGVTTVNHVGLHLLKASGAIKMRGTCGDTTGQSTSSYFGGSLAASDEIEIKIVIQSGTLVSYYYRINGAAGGLLFGDSVSSKIPSGTSVGRLATTVCSMGAASSLKVVTSNYWYGR